MRITSAQSQGKNERRSGSPVPVFPNGALLEQKPHLYINNRMDSCIMLRNIIRAPVFKLC
jgi:hypothetical protein